jgi:hypothetical protein
MAGDVLEEHERGSAFIDDPGDLGPEMSRVVGAALFSGDAEWLAGIARSDATHRSTPRSAVKGSQVVPDRCVRYVALFHTLCKNGRAVCVPLDSTNNS